MTEREELAALIDQVALAWEPDVCLLGNMTAAQLARAAALLREARPQPVPVAWLWEYIGSDPYPRRHSPVARSIHEMDPSNPPYPDTWVPIAPLYEAHPPIPTEPTTETPQ